MNGTMNNRIRMFICDDNLLFAGMIKNLTEICLPKDRDIELRLFNNPQNLLTEWNKAFADAVILDINMPQMDGFSLAARLQQSKPDLAVVFVSGQEEKVFQSYEYHPFWFIRKDDLRELGHMIPKLLACIDERIKAKQETVIFKAENRNIELNVETLTYIESCKNDIIIHDKLQNDICVRCKLSEAEKQLLPVHILRIQRGLLVNCRFIAKVNSREVIFTDGSSFNVSRDRIDFVRNAYREYLDSLC